MAVVEIKSISHRHEAIADWLLTHPDVKNLELLCHELNVTRAWLSVVMHSGVFKEYMEKRRRDWNAGIVEKIQRKQLDVTLQAYEKIETLLTDDTTDPRLVFDVAHKTAERLSFTPVSGRTIVTEERTQELVRPVDANLLGQAREILRRTVTTTKEQQLEQLPAPG